jgi:hypothetical protein
METWAGAIARHDLCCVGTIEFAWFDIPKTLRAVTQAAINKGVNTTFSSRNPAEKLEEDKEKELLVISYVWDGSSFPRK